MLGYSVFPLAFVRPVWHSPEYDKPVGILARKNNQYTELQRTPMKIGYARVSTQDQSLALQLDALRQAGCRQIYEEIVSGARVERPVLQAMLTHLREGDVMMIWKLDRLGRSLRHLIDVVTTLAQRGIGFKSLQENLDTTTSSGKLVFHMFGALAEFERDLIRERTQAGLVAARARGRFGGRPPGLAKQAEATALAAETLYREGQLHIPRMSATQSMGRLPPNPWEGCHSVHGKPATLGAQRPRRYSIILPLLLWSTVLAVSAWMRPAT
jgi:DNA invertase Pin-like site-specific DNA recombinase